MSIKALQDYTFVSKYARYIPEKKRRETWSETVDRVKDMMLKKYADIPEVHEDIEWAYEMMRKRRVLGSQRALQFGGKAVFDHNMRLYNCISSFCDRPRFFQECMYLLLCGCGTGFSVQTHHIDKLPNLIKEKDGSRKWMIEDSIEGWSEAVGVLVGSYFNIKKPHWNDNVHVADQYMGRNISFDFSLIREAGAPLSHGGKAPGSEPLKKALSKIKEILDNAIKDQKKLKPIQCYDIVMHSSDAVISGGVRRSATIAVFSPHDEEMAKAKTGNWFVENPQRGRSNNSALLVRDETTKEQFAELMKSVREFGEPGFVWSDSTELLVNPCVEISFWPVCEKTGKSGWQACNLSTINCSKVKDEVDFYEAAKAAAIIGTLQAGFTDVGYLEDTSKNILEREALIGVSMTGIMEQHEICLSPIFQKEAAKIVKQVNKDIAKKIGINQAARCTCVKPEGCMVKETYVNTSDGLMTLEEIGDIYGETWQDININVSADFNNEYKSIKFYINGLKETKKILTSGGVTLESTLNHKFRVIDNGKYIWKTADEIRVGDILPYRLGGHNCNHVVPLDAPDITNSIRATNVKKIDFQDLYLDQEFAWFLGLYTGDGSNHSNKYSIRIHGDYRKQDHLKKAQKYINSVFGLNSKIVKYNSDPEDNRCALYISSKYFYKFLEVNGLLKNKSQQIEIPILVRQSCKEVLSSFIDGYGCADGCITGRTRSFCTTSKTMADQLIQCLRGIGIDCKLRELQPTNSSYGNNVRYWIQERKARLGKTNKSKYGKILNTLDELGLTNFGGDIVEDVYDSYNYTYDIEVDHDSHTYLANSYVSHNTASCILGTSSGIHPHHAKRYIRRVQANKMEDIYKYFKSINPRACEESVWSANDTDDVISFCIEVPDGSKIKNQINAIDLLESVKSTQQNWVINGTNKALCTQPWLVHNVSNTINVTADEWEEVEEFIYNNRKWFCGISLLPVTGDKDYPQAPFTAIYLPSKIISHYGDGAMFISGLIEGALRLWEDNLWAACDSLLGLGSKPKGDAKQEWINRCHKFADKYFTDIKTLTYCMKDVYNYKLWTELKREYVDVDFKNVIEQEDKTNFEGESACNGNACELTKL